VSEVFDQLKDYPVNAGDKAFKEAIVRTRNTCGISHEMADTIVRIFMKELADSFIQNKIIELPHLGTFYFYNWSKVKQNISFKVSKEFKATRKKGGTDENNFIRAIEKPTTGDIGRDEDSLESGE
jgi:hypothetical protein